MRINNLYIKDFKNIKEQTFDFSNHNGLTLVIGNNSSGKSNLLEAICYVCGILYGLNSEETKDFSIKYSTFNQQNFEYKCEEGVLKQIPETINHPRRIVAIYSGEETRLWDKYFSPAYTQFIKRTNKAANPERMLLAPSFPSFLFLNKFYWNIALLTLLCSDSEGNKAFCKEVLGINEVNKIEFKFGDEHNYHNYTINDIVNFIKLIDQKDEYTLDEFKGILNHEYDFIGGEITPDMLFQYLYLAYTPKDSKILTDITITYNGDITISDMSEGQKKLLLIKTAYEFAGQEDTIFLLDEPDAHVHLGNKRNIVDLIQEYSHNRHTILTTHSPTLCKYAPDNSIIQMENGKWEPVADKLEAGKYLADDNDVLRLLFSTNHIVITEGKTDCKYIDKAIELYSEEYPELANIEYIPIGGTDGEVVKHFLTKIREIDGRKIIVLVDRDGGGLKCAKKVLGNDNLKKQDVDYRQISDGCYLLMIPSTQAGQSDFVIEDYFGNARLKDLTKSYINNNFDASKSFTDFPKVKDDLKKELLPKFCKTATKNDMQGFISLLDKLKEIIML